MSDLSSVDVILLH